MNRLLQDPDIATPGSLSTLAGEQSTVSWAAVLAGGVAAAAFGLILLTLGSGLGLSALSPWGSGSHGAKVFGFAAVVWVCVTQIMTCGLGGYIAGRLRLRWTAATQEEVYFRDTVHGFLAWAVATLFTAAALGSALGGLTHVGSQLAGAAASSMEARPAATGDNDGAGSATAPWPVPYLVDSLFRAPPGVPANGATAVLPTPRAEVTRILMNSAASRSPLSPDDMNYVGRLVADRTGLKLPDAEARVNFTYSELLAKMQSMDVAARQAADTARRIGIHVALWVFISLLMGAFSACLMATHGGRTRDLNQ